MYKSIPNNLTNQELTSVIHFAVKMLNKYKSKENREIKLADLPVNPGEKLLPICNALLDEIGLEQLEGKDKEIDKHIDSLFQMLKQRLDQEINRLTNQGKVLLERFKRSNI